MGTVGWDLKRCTRAEYLLKYILASSKLSRNFGGSPVHSVHQLRLSINLDRSLCFAKAALLTTHDGTLPLLEALDAHQSHPVINPIPKRCGQPSYVLRNSGSEQRLLPPRSSDSGSSGEFDHMGSERTMAKHRLGVTKEKGHTTAVEKKAVPVRLLATH